MTPRMERNTIAEASQAVSQFLVTDVPVGETLQRIVALARDAMGAAAGGITLLDDGEKLTTAVYTDEISPRVDKGQYEDGTGPCIDAFRLDTVVRVDDTSAVADKWPSFSRDAGEVGVSSTLSLPLSAAGTTFGALNLYAKNVNAFRPEDEDSAAGFATQVAVVVANTMSYWDAVDLGEGLKSAMQSRAAIEQAKGIIMATQQCGPDDAFQILVRASQRSNAKLRDIAVRIVERRRMD